MLTELEEWTSILQAEPEVIHRLAAFADAADGQADVPHDGPDMPPAPEPSP